MRNKKQIEQIILEQKILNIIKNVIIILVAGILLFLYFHFYNPRQHAIEKNASRAYAIIEKATLAIYKEKGYLFDANQKEGEFCELLAQKLEIKNPQCYSQNLNLNYNFTLKKPKVEIWGLEKKADFKEGKFTKEFFIDADGKKGENQIGLDRYPLKMYSEGFMAGRLSPVNCSFLDSKDFGFEFSPLCQNTAININYQAQNKPFGFNVIQIAADKGKSQEILHDVPFLRADCAAMGGDLIADDYCEEKKIYWLSACYDDNPCAITIETNK